MSETTLSGRVEGLRQWRGDHERQCDERQADIKKAIGRLEAGAWGLVISILLWMAVQLWQGQQDRLSALEHARAVAAAAP